MPKMPKKNGHEPVGILERFKSFVRETRELVVKNYLSIHASPAYVVTRKISLRPDVKAEPLAPPPPIISLPPHPKAAVSTAVLVAKSAKAHRIRYSARQTLNGLPSFTTEDTDINNDKHVILDPRRLGFKRPPFMSEILDRSFLSKWSAENLKNNHVLDMCHPTKGFRIVDSNEYPEQAVEDLLLIMTAPIPDSKYKEVIFAVECCRDDKKQWLSTASATPDCQVPLDCHCLFRERVIA
jgi:hypothetical protein